MRRRSAGWSIGLGISAAVHLGVLVGLFAYGWAATKGDATPIGAPLDVRALLPTSVSVELTSVEATRPTPVDVPPPVARLQNAPEGDRANQIVETRAPADAEGRDRQAPAPDSGRGAGAPSDHAFRLDRSTLRARLSDGAAEPQPARLRSSRRRASPQAIRQEPRVGVGDSVRNVSPRRALSSPAAAADLALGGEPGGAAENPGAAALSRSLPLAAPLAPRSVALQGVGPLDVEAGRRSFDVQQPGPAADNRTQRVASNELHPGLTDFTRATVARPQATADGRGPGRTAGAVARPSTGTAPAELGAPSPQATDVDVDQRTTDRRYQRYFQEILRQVNAIDDFPKALALRLEQGETIVQFVVGADGRLIGGPRVLKGAGFQEFDAAALRKVRRAAPFPPLPNPGVTRSLRLSLRVTFDDPVIR